MRDLGAEATDKAREALEKRIRSVYLEAQKDMQAKLGDFTRRFKVKDAMYQKQLKEGKITQAQYQQWLRGQVFQSDRWKQKLEQITTTLNESNKVATGIINGEVNGIFAYNANWQSYTLEHGAGLNFGFEIYDSSTVARLLRDEPDLLPRKKVNIPKDKAWNRKKITRQITQGIIQGESLDKIAKRLQKVTDMNRNTALTNAQTAMTGAQNAGRQESLNRATKMGIQVKKEWLATLDGHTRTEHGQLDGQKVDVDKPFRIGGYTIAYPGDPHAHPAMIYNCRCTLIGDLVKYPSKDAKRYDNIDGKPIKDMTFSQWLKVKKSKKEDQDAVKNFRATPVTSEGYGKSSEDGSMKTVRLYHGSFADFEEFDFDAGKAFKAGGADAYGEGFYFTPDADQARLYGDNIYMVEIQYSTDRRMAKKTGRIKDFDYNPKTGYWVIPKDKSHNITIIGKKKVE